jgi:tRNA(fMet)-specific endonuclease VapC
MSAFLLDTNTVIAFTRAPRNSPVSEQCRRVGPQALRLSSIVLHELYFGAFNSLPTMRDRNLAVINTLGWDVAAFDSGDAAVAGEVRSILRAIGRPIGPYDLLIAGQALARGWTVVTNNTREFSRIEGLACEDWTLPNP